MKELTINLNNKLKTPLYEQIYIYIKGEIKANRIHSGVKLPSARALAKHLSVSRTTIDMAYMQLMSEGYIESVPCKGYYVADITLLYNIRSNDSKEITVEKHNKAKATIDFSPRGIDLNNFPYGVWRKITKNILDSDNRELFKTGHPKGDEQFRNTICDYLFEARGVYCKSEQIVLGAGSEYLLLLLDQLFHKRMQIAMENPTYIQAYRVFNNLGSTVFPIEMDSYGMKVMDLYNCGADIAYVMPSHQYPLGIVMPIKRRLELLKWTRDNPDKFIIEDDYDSEFRYKGKPIPALKSLEGGENVIYIGTFSKSISPSIRMSYMVLPIRLLENYQKNISFYSSTVSMIDQAIVNEFITKGHYERHLNKMRSLYKNKHDILISELKGLNVKHRVLGENAGLHVLLELDIQKKEQEIIGAIQKNGVRLYGLSDYYITQEGSGKPTLILGYANLMENEIIKGVELIKSAV